MIYTAGAAYTMIVSVAFDEKKLAVTLIPVLLIPFMLLSGFVVNESRFPWYLMPLAYGSFYKYGFQALMLNEYEGLELECEEISPDSLGGHCDPLGDFNSPQSKGVSMLCLILLIIACLGIAFTIMKSLSKRAH